MTGHGVHGLASSSRSSRYHVLEAVAAGSPRDSGIWRRVHPGGARLGVLPRGVFLPFAQFSLPLPSHPRGAFSPRRTGVVNSCHWRNFRYRVCLTRGVRSRVHFPRFGRCTGERAFPMRLTV